MSFCNIIQHFRRRILQPRSLSPLSQVLFFQHSPLISRPYINSTSSSLPSSKLSSKQYIDAFIVSIILFGTSLIVYENSPSRRVNKAVQKGTRPELHISRIQYYPRPQVLEQLKKIFTPNESSRSNYIIYGKDGIGKSTLIKMASREVGQGVIYVDIPPNINNFGKEFAKAVNIWLFNNKQWKKALLAFEKAAKVYKAKYGRPLVIIYDNVDYLIQKNTDILDQLQSSVAESSNKGKYIAVFVSSEYSVLQRMSSHDIPPNINNFGKEFAKAVNIWLFNNKQWKKALLAFEKAAKVYKAKYGRPLVIIYDNVDYLIQKNTDILDQLQSSVAESSNKGKYIAVFVSSEYSVLQRMSSHGHWTDMEYFEIGDLTKEESIDYLNKKNIREEEARKIYELVGGCLIDLHDVTNDLFSGRSFEDIKKIIKNEVETKFRIARLLPGDKYYDVGKKIINTLLDSKELCASELREHDELLRKNVFEYHPYLSNKAYIYVALRQRWQRFLIKILKILEALELNCLFFSNRPYYYYKRDAFEYKRDAEATPFDSKRDEALSYDPTL
ncbi:hypothetical protein Glove_139g63 [Diversispora epigaea]|uniref:AAA+ ATPase domain-containing protein n=1 Tax=Diversispora epigaea TaxID=1348612 RepID=A0A397IVE4_9GLOM|nr:hypothetical protein Glove_139g63 [Diversispora epigaea]